MNEYKVGNRVTYSTEHLTKIGTVMSISKDQTILKISWDDGCKGYYSSKHFPIITLVNGR